MLKIHAKSDIGLVRNNNEDFYFTDTEKRLIIVADGAGGHDHGEIASRVAVESCYQYLTREDYLEDTSNIPRTLLESITFANQQVIEYKQKHLPGSDMGTTLSCVHIGDSEASFAWMGDSRIYHITGKDNRLTQLSTDHTLYQEMLDRGEVGKQFNKHILSRMLGNNPYTRPDADRHPLQEGDLLLVCSDGFSDLVTTEKILAVTAGMTTGLEAGVEAMIGLARGQGGRDNITVVLGRVS